MRQHVADARIALGDITAQLKLSTTEMDIPAMATAVEVASAALVNVERAAAKLEGIQVQLDALVAETAQLRADGVRPLVDTCRWAVLVGLVALALGGGGMLLKDTRPYAMCVAASGGILLAGGVFIVVALPALAVSVPWVVTALAVGLIALIALAVVWLGVRVVVRIIGTLRAVGPAAQAKLAAKGDIAGAASAAFAAVGGGKAGRIAAKALKQSLSTATAVPENSPDGSAATKGDAAIG
jgi:hypothetical protein